MADAGKVAILPRGLWNAETVYEPLDLVYYNNNSFVALKESVGVTPVDGDTWMLSLSGISQETIEAIINGTQRVGDSAKLGGKEPSEYALDTDLANYLPLSGGTINGRVNVSASDYAPLFVTNKNSGGASFEKFLNGDGLLGFLGFNSKNKPTFKNAEETANYELLHTGNKPSGTYTGNGETADREIKTGGIGSVCVITSDKGIALLTEVGFNSTLRPSGTNSTFQAGATFNNGTIYTATTHDLINAAGVAYKYFVL